MAKKNFIEGLDSIFGGINEEPEDLSTSLLNKDKKPDTKDKKPKKRKRGSKNFTSDLDTLLEEALQESVYEKLEQQEKKQPKKRKTYATKKRRLKNTSGFTGLDALIRQTVESSEMELNEQPDTPKKKRITFTFDKDKVEKLRSIAKLEKAFIKDIVDEIVSEYIKGYEENKGNIKP